MLFVIIFTMGVGRKKNVIGSHRHRAQFNYRANYLQSIKNSPAAPGKPISHIFTSSDPLLLSAHTNCKLCERRDSSGSAGKLLASLCPKLSENAAKREQKDTNQAS